MPDPAPGHPSPSPEDEVAGRLIDEGFDALAGTHSPADWGAAVDDLQVPGGIDPYLEEVRLRELQDEAQAMADRTGRRPARGSMEELGRIVNRSWHLILVALVFLVVIVTLFAVLSTGEMTDQQASGGSGPTAPSGASGVSGPTGASAGGIGPGGIPASCVLTADQMGLGVGELVWQDRDDGLYATWSVAASNPSTERYVLYMHKVADANAGTRATKWKPYVRDWFKAQDADATVFDVNLMGVPPGAGAERVAGSDARVSTSVESGLPSLCSYEYTDRVLGVWGTPGCNDALHALLSPLVADASAQNELMMEWSVEAPIPDQLKGWRCPE